MQGVDSGVVSGSQGALCSLNSMVTGDNRMHSPPLAVCASPVFLMSSSLCVLESVFKRSRLHGRKCSCEPALWE